MLTDLGLEPATVDEDRWREAIGGAVKARSREQVARALSVALDVSRREPEPADDTV